MTKASHANLRPNPASGSAGMDPPGLCRVPQTLVNLLMVTEGSALVAPQAGLGLYQSRVHYSHSELVVVLVVF